MADWREDEWELYNDGVLVCHRKKRRLLQQPLSMSDPQQPDPETEEKNRRARKKKTLTKLIEKYRNELRSWDNLSNSLRTMEENANRRREIEQEEERGGDEDPGFSAVVSASGSVLDEILLKVNIEESVIQDVSNLCDISEALCGAQEEAFKQSLFDLPIWGSPRTLMASLCSVSED